MEHMHKQGQGTKPPHRMVAVAIFAGGLRFTPVEEPLPRTRNQHIGVAQYEQRWCEHVGGLGPEFSLCRICI